MTPETGVLGALITFAGTMLAAMVVAYKTVADVLKEQNKICQAEKTTCLTENKATVDKSYALVTAFNELKAVMLPIAAKVEKNERVLDDLARERRVEGR